MMAKAKEGHTKLQINGALLSLVQGAEYRMFLDQVAEVTYVNLGHPEAHQEVCVGEQVQVRAKLENLAPREGP